MWSTAGRWRDDRGMDLMLGLNDTIGPFSMLSSVRRYGHVLSGENGHVLRISFLFEVEGQRMNLRLKWT